MGLWLIGVVIDGLAFCAAMLVVPGLDAPDGRLHFLIAAALFGIVSATVRPVLWVLSCPLICITLAPMIVLLHALMLWFSGWLAGLLGVNVVVGGVLPAIAGAVVIGVVRMVALTGLRYYESRRTFSRNQADLQQLQRTKEWLEQQCDHWKRRVEEGNRRIGERSDRINPSPEDRRRIPEPLLESRYVIGSQSHEAVAIRHRRLDRPECPSEQSARIGNAGGY